MFKGGDNSDVVSYKPLTEIFERLTFNKLFDDVRLIIHSSQHGFTMKGKLRTAGFSCRMVQWFSTYLRDRSQFVVVGKSKSVRATPTLGKFRYLDHFFFIIFINDLLASLSSCSR